MDELFRKYCFLYATNGSKEELSALNLEAGQVAANYQKKALKFIKNLRHKVKKLGYNIDFESFCNLLEEYITKKDDFEDDTKKAYLKVLFSLSKIYEINLREELEKYVSYKKVTDRQITERDVFRHFCLYSLHPNEDVSEFNRLNSVCEVNHLNFAELQKNSLIFVEEIKQLIEPSSFKTDIEDVYKMIEKYHQTKKSLSYQEKSRYLKVLLYLCEIYNINLRSLITKQIKEPISPTITTKNPLDNRKMMNQLIRERYENGFFQIANFNYNGYLFKEHTYNYSTELSLLVYNIYQIFIDKFTNYAYEDLNHLYSNCLTEEDIMRLQDITQEDLAKMLIEINKHESTHYICKKYKLPENLYKFITKSIHEAIDLKSKSIGYGEHSLFNVPDTQNTISIYFNGPDTTIIALLKKYIKKCIDLNLNYELDGLNYDNTTYKTIIYCSKSDFKEKIKILDEIIKNDSQISSSLVLPLPFSNYQKDKLYSISRRYISNDKHQISYFEYIDRLLEVSYYRSIAKIIISRITDLKEKEIINHLITLKNFSCQDLIATNATFDNLSFKVIKDTINNYIPLITNTITKYISDKAYQDDFIIEFNKAILYISNFIEGKDKYEKRNITINN